MNPGFGTNLLYKLSVALLPVRFNAEARRRQGAKNQIDGKYVLDGMQ